MNIAPSPVSATEGERALGEPAEQLRNQFS